MSNDPQEGEQSSKKPTSRKRIWLFRLVAVALATIFTLVAAEIMLRVLRPQIFPPHPPGMYVDDDAAGYVLTPGFTGEFRGAEFSVGVSINSTGQRGAELQEPQPGATRVLCVGDSFTWGWGVEDREAYPAVLDMMLRDRNDSRDFQVINAGVPGYGNDEELELLKKTIADIGPDIVIVQFCAGNDFDENRHPARATHSVRDGMLHKTRPPGVAKPPLWLGVLNKLKRRSHVLHLVSNQAGYLAMRMGILAGMEKSLSIFFTEEDGARATGFLSSMAEVASSSEASTVFVFVPNKAQLISRPETPLRASTVVAQAAEASGSRWIDLTGEFQQRDNVEEMHFVQDAHWTAAGHRLVAGVLADHLLESDEDGPARSTSRSDVGGAGH